MTPEQYEELLYELNFHDSSVGIRPVAFDDEEAISDVLTAFDCTPLGYYETKNSKGFQFQCGAERYVIQEGHDQLNIFKHIEV